MRNLFVALVLAGTAFGSVAHAGGGPKPTAEQKAFRKDAKAILRDAKIKAKIAKPSADASVIIKVKHQRDVDKAIKLLGDKGTLGTPGDGVEIATRGKVQFLVETKKDEKHLTADEQE